jgi:LPPG:FO 2-phospho-L-lactate transferase
MIDGIALALSGGVGGAKLALGLTRVLASEELAIVANTGDDFEHLGLHISPDVDTLLYTLSGINNPETGWGRAEETWSCMTDLRRLRGETWFRMGDKDLALHLYRTAQLKNGANLSAVIDGLRKHLEIGPEVLPMSDQPVRTQVETDEGLLQFQQYFVRKRCEPVVKGLHFAGASDAAMTPRFAQLLASSALGAIIICPSNPYLSIDPILAIPGVRQAIKGSAAPTIAVSPIVDGRAIKGPTAKLMTELGVPVSPTAVVQHYGDLLDGFILDEADAGLASSIETSGIACAVTGTVMRTLEDRTRLARDVLDFARTLRRMKQ